MSTAYVLKRLKEFHEGDMVTGVDPDLHTTAVCFWEVGELLPCALTILRVPKEFRGQDCAARLQQEMTFGVSDIGSVTLCVVEGQRMRYGGASRTKRPQDLIDLAAVTGVFLGRPEFGETLVVEPSTWKGSMSKATHQARTLLRIPGTRIKSTKAYSYPVAGPLVELGERMGIKRTDWKHLADAVGIAQWTIKKILEFQKRERLLRRRRGT